MASDTSIIFVNTNIFDDVYILAWIARWDCQVHSLLCRAVKLYARSDVAKSVAKSFMTREIDTQGTIRYVRGPHRQLHRVDGPAAEYANGYKIWLMDGSLHRTDGPAIDSTWRKEWWVNGHRIAGPVVEWVATVTNGELMESVITSADDV